MDRTRAALPSQLVDAVWDCEQCTCRLEARLPVPPVCESPSTTRILFVGLNPGQTEDMENLPFVGPAGIELANWIKRLAFKESDYCLTNLVLCHTTNNRTPVEAEIRSCVKTHLLPLIKFLAPSLQVIVPLGEIAAKRFGFESFKANNAGDRRVLLVDGKEIDVMAMIHPGAVIRTGSRFMPLVDYAGRELIRILCTRGWNEPTI